MADRGRPPMFPNVAAFEERLENYEGGFFKWCEDNKHFPLWEWFAVYMGCSRDIILDYMKKDGLNGGENYDAQQDFRPVIKRIGEQIMANIAECGLLGKCRDAVTIFYMKNYGYSDKQEVDTKMTVTVQMTGFEEFAD